MRKRISYIVLFSVTVFLAITCTPTGYNKNAGVLQLNAPVECPDGVHFVWTGGQAGAHYSIYRRLHGDGYWERIAMGLSGVTGVFDFMGFTLDHDWDYKIQAEQ